MLSCVTHQIAHLRKWTQLAWVFVGIMMVVIRRTAKNALWRCCIFTFFDPASRCFVYTVELSITCRGAPVLRSRRPPFWLGIASRSTADWRPQMRGRSMELERGPSPSICSRGTSRGHLLWEAKGN